MDGARVGAISHPAFHRFPGAGLGNKFLANIRECDTIVEVVRCFDDPDVTHVDGTVDAIRDLDIIDTELALADLGMLEKVRLACSRGACEHGADALQLCVRSLMNRAEGSQFGSKCVHLNAQTDALV